MTTLRDDLQKIIDRVKKYTHPSNGVFLPDLYKQDAKSGGELSSADEIAAQIHAAYYVLKNKALIQKAISDAETLVSKLSATASRDEHCKAEVLTIHSVNAKLDEIERAAKKSPTAATATTPAGSVHRFNYHKPQPSPAAPGIAPPPSPTRAHK